MGDCEGRVRGGRGVRKPGEEGGKAKRGNGGMAVKGGEEGAEEDGGEPTGSLAIGPKAS